MLRSSKTALSALALGVTLVLSGCGQSDGAAGAGGLTSVKVIQPSAASDNLALILGDNEGIFARHGLELELVSAPQVGANQVASLLNGQLEIGNGSITSAMSAVAEGIPVRVVAALAADNETDGRPLYDTLVGAESDIRSFRDLEGRTVALNSLRSTWQASVSEAIVRDGGDPTRVEFVQLTFPNQVTALQQGQVDAIFTTQPFATQLVGSGYRSIGDAQAVALDDPRGVSTVVQASQAFVDENPDTVRNFVAALQEASDFANANPEAVRNLAVEQAGATGATAESIMNSPLPFYTTEIDADTVDRWGSLLVGFGFAETAPAAADVLWDGATP